MHSLIKSQPDKPTLTRAYLAMTLMRVAHALDDVDEQEGEAWHGRTHSWENVSNRLAALAA